MTLPHKARSLMVFLTAVLAAPLLGFLIMTVHRPQVEAEAYANLTAITKLKVGQIENWLGERRGNASMLAANRGFIEKVRDLQVGVHGARETCADSLQTGMEIFGYESKWLLDAEGRLLLAVGTDADQPIPPHFPALLARALETGQVQQGPLYRDVAGVPHLDFLAPLVLVEGGKRQAVGAVVLRADPALFLYPLIQAWPTESASGETLLVHREGDHVVFMNELRHRKGLAFKVRSPVSTPDLPAAVSIRKGGAGTTAGTDYRGLRVLAAYWPVAGTDWYLVAKLDADEVLAPHEKLAFWVAVTTFFVMVAFGTVLLLFWRQRELIQGLAILQVENSLGESEERLKHVVDSALDALVIIDAEGTIVDWHPHAETIFGWSRAEATGQPMHTLIIPPQYREAHLQGMRHFLSTGEGPILNRRVETVGLHQDGREFPIDLAIAAHKRRGQYEFSAFIRDITERKGMEERQRALVVARDKAMEDGLQSVARALELRDPYTTGHQQRVAELAAAIGRGLLLTEDRCYGIHLAGIVHDMGKIQIPAEILTRPVRLSPEEYGLMKTHPQGGYEILRGIDFPWPIAQVAQQHHERMDGSGYPQGLMGEAITLEARIVAVADVVESMAANRPYRMGLGIEKAMEEIAHNRGRLYDAEVVDVCIALFREKGFAWTGDQSGVGHVRNMPLPGVQERVCVAG